MSSSNNIHSKSTALEIIKNYRVPELQALLEYGNLPKQGQKRDLLQRCKILINTNFSPQLANKIQQINNNRIRSSRSNNISSTNSNSSVASTKNQPIVISKTPPKEVLPASNHVQYVNLPFFDKMRSIDSVNIPVDWNTFSPLRFVLNETDIDLIRKGSTRVFIRIGPTISNERQNDVLPPFLFVQCNSQLVINNNVSKTVGAQAHSICFPTDITDKIIFKANATNTLTFGWLQSPTTMSLKNLPRAYTICIQLVHCVSVDTLFELIVKREPYKIENDEDSDIEVEDLGLMTTTHRVSLLCPITQSLICVPAKSSHCSHMTCFDLRAFLQMNERRLQWTCPLCKKSASFESLRVDHRLQGVLKNVPQNCSTVEISSPTECQYILDTVKQEKIEPHEKQIVEEALDLTANSSNRSRNDSVGSDCIVLSSGTESDDEDNDDDDEQPVDLSHSQSRDRSSPFRRNSKCQGETNSQHSSPSITSLLTSSVHEDANYWQDIAQITGDRFYDQNERCSSRKRSNSSNSSIASSKGSSESSDKIHRKRRRRSSTPRQPQPEEIELITISSSDSDDLEHHDDQTQEQGPSCYA